LGFLCLTNKKLDNIRKESLIREFKKKGAQIVTTKTVKGNKSMPAVNKKIVIYKGTGNNHPDDMPTKSKTQLDKRRKNAKRHHGNRYLELLRKQMMFPFSDRYKNVK
jgi:hypothetical protein